MNSVVEQGVLGAVFCNPAPLIANSIDPSSLRRPLKKGSLPLNPALMGEPKTFYGFNPLDYILNEASSDPDAVKQRQQILSELQKLAADETAHGLFRDCFAAGELHDWLTSSVFDPKLSTKEQPIYTPRIEQYRRDSASRKASDSEQVQYRPDDFPVWQLPTKLHGERKAAAAFNNHYAQDYPHLARLAEQQGSYTKTKASRSLCVSVYIQNSGKELNSAQQRVLDDSAKMYRHTTNTLALASFVSTLPAKPAHVSGAREITLDNFFHPRFNPAAQSRHSITISDRPVIITGSPGSGKTFATEAIAAAIRNGLSTGHVAAESAVVPPVRLLQEVARPESGGELSAFGEEVVKLGKLVTTVETLLAQNPDAITLYIGDEPFSGTDPDERQELLIRYLDGLRRLGIMALVTTHDDMSAPVEAGAVVAYRASKDKGEHLLEPGIAHSDAFTEARNCQFAEEVLARAEAIAKGAPLDLTETETRQLNPEDPIAWFKSQGGPAGFMWFGNTKPACPSQMDDDYNYTRITKARDGTVPKAAPMYNAALILGSDSIFNHYEYPLSVLHTLLQEGSTSSIDVLRARQDFFVRITEYGQKDDLRTDLDDFRRLVFALSRDRYRFGEDPLEPELYNPLANVAQTFTTLLKKIEVEIDPYHSMTEEEFSHLLDTKDAYALQLLRTIQAMLNPTDEKPQTFIADYISLLEEIQNMYRPLKAWLEYSTSDNAYEKRVAHRQPVDIELRDKLYAFGKAHFKKDGWSQKNFLEKLDDIFYPTSYDPENNELIRHESTQLTYTSIYRLHDLFMPHHKGVPEKLQKIIKKSGLQLNGLPNFVSEIDALYRAAVTVEQAGGKTPVVRTLSILRFVADDHKPIDAIITHLEAIDGTIAQDLAHYYDTNTRLFFASKASGSLYGKWVSQQLQTQEDYPNLPIGNVSRNRWDFAGKLPVTPYSEAILLMRLLDIATFMKEHAYAPWEEADYTTITQTRNVSHRNHTANNVTYQQGGIDVLSGANMSGKTTLLRTLFANHALIQATGFSPSSSMSSPLYQHIIFADRPKHDTSKGLGSFGMEMEYWKTITEKLRYAAPSLVVVDEPFSTIPSYYQEAFLLASLEWLAKRGHRVVLATHHHGAVKRLEEAKNDARTTVEISFRHFKTEKNEKREVRFTHQLADGVAPSDAMTVAKQFGGPALAKVLGI